MILLGLLLALLVYLLTGSIIFTVLIVLIVLALFAFADRPYGYRRRGGPPV